MLCKYPPMGWNSWDCYGTSVTEAIVRKNAEYMAKHLKSGGWEYVVVDIQWYHSDAVDFDYKPFSDPAMDEWGRLMPAVNRFPSASGGEGFGPLAAYIHGLGLKFGIHIMRGIPRVAAHLHLPVADSAYGHPRQHGRDSRLKHGHFRNEFHRECNRRRRRFGHPDAQQRNLRLGYY